MIKLPDFLLSFEDYLKIPEPPMRNFKWIETTNSQNKYELGSNMGIGQNNFSTNKSTQRRAKWLVCCNYLFILQCLWFIIVSVGVVYIMVEDIMPYF